MKNIIFKGCGTAIATPFNENGVNFEVFGDLIENQISEGVDAIIVCGTTGEAATMTEQERKDTIKFVVDKVAGRIPVIAGTGSNNTAAAIEMTKYVESIGVDGALVVTPYYNKTTQKGLVEHYKAIASSTKLPIIVYSVPSRTGVNVAPDTCLELSKIENIVAIKEASGNISQVAKIASLCGDNLNIYSGNDDQIVPVLSVGGIGVISVLSNVYPKYTHEMVYDYLEGNVAEATKKQLACLNVVDNLFSEVNPIPVKAALNMKGYDYGIPRLPLIEMSENKKADLKKAMEEFE
ncbi:MAG: 4-hydroxy-tetrahydrodipicolinate synthase [Clostridia bacterium]|nr:4-hydroxy-tetrahydrodipicolinate synthase [Clostridia bacterium]